MTEHSETILFCLPFAGGSAFSYSGFQRYADDGLRIEALDLPGRGRRFHEPLLNNLDDMADDVLRQIRSRIYAGPYAVYGHSMGAWIAYLLVKRMLREGCPPPCHLFVSGRQAPALQGKEKGWHLLPRAAFMDIVRQFGGTSSEVIANQELMELFEPVLRADFQALANCAYEKSEPFDIPLTVMWGNAENVTRAGVLPWQEETTQAVSFLEFNGGHFFIFEHTAQIVRIFSRAAARFRDTAAFYTGT